MSQTIRCHACLACFALDPEMLHPYRDAIIQGQRAPRYWAYCPACGQKNVIDLTPVPRIIPGKPSAR